MARLRQAIGDSSAKPPFLWIERTSIQFNAASAYELDVTAFTSLLSACDAHTHRHAETCPACTERRERAVALYRGAFLDKFYIDDSDLFEEWAIRVREQLHQRALGALAALVAYHERRGNYAQALRYCERELELDPWREEAYRRVMRMLALTGQRSAALMRYEGCRAILDAELGVAPAAETTALYERIRAAEPYTLVSTEDLAPPAVRRYNLPVQPTPFIGREPELAALADLLADPQCRLITVLGPGGIGKTRLALQAASDESEAFADGAAYVPLAPLTAAEFIVPTVAAALNFTLDGPAAPETQLLHYLRQKELLLVLDNIEHLLTPPTPIQAGKKDCPATELLADILQQAPDVTLLVTSRERLQLSAETAFWLEGMDYPEAENGDGERYSALDLFVQRARQVQPGFEPDEADRRAIARICRLVGGMPLGLVLAAGWVAVLTPRRIATELEENLELLETDLRDVPARQRSMQAVFEQTWERLSRAEQTTYMKLSVFRQGFTYPAARAVAEASPTILAGLANKGLLARTPDGRYQIHELTRQYGADKLSNVPGLAETTLEHHCAYFAARLQEQETHLWGTRRMEVLREIGADLENVRLAWQWATGRGQAQRLDQMLESLGHFYKAQGRDAQGATDYRRAADTLIAAAAAPATLVRLKIWQGGFAETRSGDLSSTRFFEEGLALLDGPTLAGRDMRRERANTLMHLAFVIVGSDRNRAQECFQQSLALCREIDDVPGVIRSLGGLAWIARHAGAYGEVDRLLAEGLALCEKLEAPMLRAFALQLLGFTALEQGQFGRAERLFREDLAIRRQMDSAPDFARGLRNLGVALTLTGRFAQGYAHLAEAKAIYSDLGDGSGLLFTKGWMGFASLHLGEYAQARAYGRQAVDLARKAGHWGMLANALFVLGSVALAEDVCAEAQASFAECIPLYRKLNQRIEWGTVLATAAYVARADGNAVQARQLLAQALHVPTPEAFYPRAVALPVLALLLADRGDVERALEAHALAARMPYIANSRWFHDVAGKQLEAAAATLPPEIVTAAHERAQALELRTATAELLAAVTA